MSEPIPCWGVYRVLASGAHEYVSRSATTNEKLAAEIASDLSIGRVIRPDGRELQIPPHPHVYRLISDPSADFPTTGATDPRIKSEEGARAPAEQSAQSEPVTVNVAGHEHPVPKGWEHISADDDVTVTLTRAELAALIHACGVAEDEGQFDGDVNRAAWEKLIRIEQF